MNREEAQMVAFQAMPEMRFHLFLRQWKKQEMESLMKLMS